MSNLKLSVSLLEEDKVLQEGAAGTLTWGAGEGRKVSPRKAEQIEIDLVFVLNAGDGAPTRIHIPLPAQRTAVLPGASGSPSR